MDVTRIKVVAMDLDGTLTQHKQPMTPQVRQALEALQKKYKLIDETIDFAIRIIPELKS